MTKKFVKASLGVIIISCLAACGGSSSSNDAASNPGAGGGGTSELTGSFFPLQVGNTWTYNEWGSDVVVHTIVSTSTIDVDGNQFQSYRDDYGSDYGSGFELDDDSPYIRYKDPSTEIVWEFINSGTAKRPVIVDTLSEGDSVSIGSLEGSGQATTFEVLGTETIGALECMKLLTIQEGYYMEQWFSRGVGLVKQIGYYDYDTKTVHYTRTLISATIGGNDISL